MKAVTPCNVLMCSFLWVVVLIAHFSSSLYTGAYRLKVYGDGVNDYRMCSTGNGLSGNDITQIVEGRDRSIWFATRNGADLLITDSNGNEKIIHYNEKIGPGRLVHSLLPDDSITCISYEEGFFAVSNCLNHAQENHELNVIITDITVMGKSDPDALRKLNEYYSLPYNRNFISFGFTSVQLEDNEGITYQYKLDGIDKEWSEYSDRHYASYNSLPHGKYKFSVRAKMINNNTVVPETIYLFKIRPPYYLTLWFFLLAGTMLIAVHYFMYTNRIRHLLKLQRLRTKIASDLHDDIGSTLSSISIMTDLLQSQLDNSIRAEEMIQTIGFNAHNMLESMDDIIWSVNPSNDSFQNLALRIREYSIPLFESKDIQFQIITPDELVKLPLSMDIRRNLFLIVKEAVNNLVKYSDCSLATVRFGYVHSILTVKIEDNGKGFDTKRNYNSRNGLKNIKLRADQIHGKLSILSESGKGTTISLTVKIK